MKAPPSPGCMPVLFSLQVAIDALSFHPPPTRAIADSPRSFLLAFQLLQFDIVEAEASALGEHGGVVSLSTEASGEGESCLFESDAQQLETAIREDESAALVLLVLQRDVQRAKLLAFACVRLELPHLSVAYDGKTPRVSEWASVEATWPLVDHDHVTCGSISGRVTLACLGRALAPHVASQRLIFGQSVPTLTASPRATTAESPRDETPLKQEATEDAESNASTVFPNDKLNVVDTAQSPGKPAELQVVRVTQDELRDVAIQCSDPGEEQGEEPLDRHRHRHPKPILIHGGRSSRDSPRCKVVDELDRLRISKTASPINKSPRAGAETIRSQRDRRHDTCQPLRRSVRRYADADAAAFGEAELPPPLFFHRPKRHPKT